MATPTRYALFTSLAGLVLAAGLASPPRAAADDIEVFFSDAPDPDAKPNILFILDTSQSMYTVESSTPAAPYDPATTYGGSCDSAKYYWTVTGQATPKCGESGWAALDDTQFNCPNWKGDVNTKGLQTKTSRVAQRPSANWGNITTHPSQTAGDTACQGDTSPTPSGVNWSAKNKGKDVYPSVSYTFYDGNWLNWAAQSGGDKYRIDLIREAVAEVIESTSNIKVGLMRLGYDGDRVFRQNTGTACEIEPDPVEGSRSSNGAPILFPVTDLESTTGVTGFPLSKDTIAGETPVRSQLRYQLGIDNRLATMGWVVDPSKTDGDQPFQIAKGGGNTCPIPLFTPGGRSPLGGAMYEAYNYYAGNEWSQKYGKQADLGSTFDYPSVPQSLIAGTERYKSPISQSCAKNFIILLSDGTTEQDNDVDGSIERLPGFGTAVGRDCDDDPYLDVNGNPPPSQCVDDAAEYMLETDLNPSLPGINNVITYTIGFKLGNDAVANSARQLLEETATRGGGSFYEAGNAVELKDRFGTIIREILTLNTSFSAPAVTVNAFNRTQNLNDLYMSLFRPAFNYRWNGNIKKYQLDPMDGDILDAAGRPAVDPGSGFFFNNARSFWSATADGSDITAGGAAGLLEYDERTVLTTNSSGDTVELDSTGLYTDGQLGILSGDQIKSPADTNLLTATNLIQWFHGKDIADEDGDTLTDESRYEMGDPLHARPVSVIYGGTVSSPSVDDAVLFAVTNDGVLHAFNPSSSDPSERWAFIPRDLVGRMRDLYYNRVLTQPEDRGYGLDNNIRVLRIDNNNNGIIEPASPQNDKVYLYFGQRRGGTMYYAFDVSTKSSPRLLWSRSYASDGAGQSWSTPQVSRVRDGSTAKNVLVFGGGYDVARQGGINYVEDTVGIGVYIVDALTGDLIWRAGPDSGANLRLTEMRHSMPADVRAFDLTGDGFLDRIYASDLGGRVWRFDVFNGKASTGTSEGDRLVEGGMFASLGNAEDGSSRLQSNTIRFFYSPDPALITEPGPSFINVGIGSGNRELPATDKTVQNWFFSMRDYNVLTQLRSSWYKDDCTGATTPCHEIIVEGDLEDLTSTVGASATTSVPVGAGASRGWRIALEEEGEKVLAESRTFQGDVFFTTYAPVQYGVTDDGCGTKFGLNKLYVVNAVDARPAYNYDAAVGESVADRSKELAQGSIAPEVVFIFPTPPTTRVPTACANTPGCDPDDPSTWPVPPSCASTPGCDPDDPSTWPVRPGSALPPICLVGLESCGFGLANPPVRTYWRQRGAN